MAITGQLTLNQIIIAEVDTDPTVSGILAPIGSMAILSNGTSAKMWLKTNSGDTNWLPISKQGSATNLATGSIPFADSDGSLISNGLFVWDNVNLRLGIGVVPQSTLHIDKGTSTPSRMRFTAGTTTGQTASDGLEVGIDALGNAELINNEATEMNFYTNGNRLMRLTPTGELLVGTNAARVDITGLGAYPLFQIIGTTSVQMAGIQFSADPIGPVFNLLKSRGGLNAQGIVSADDEFGRIQFRASDGVNFFAGASIRGLVDGTPGVGSMPGRLIFLTTPLNSTLPVERMRISQDGLVKVVDALEWKRMVQDFTTQATANSTLTMTNASTGIQVFTGTVAGQIVRLPDATTLTIGATYEIRNSSNQILTVQDSAGGALDTTPYTSGTTLAMLLSNGTAAGTWLIRTRFEFFTQEVNSTVGMSINSATDVLITGMTITPPAGVYRVSFDAAVQVGTSNSTLGFAIYVGGTINANSNRSFAATGTNTILSYKTSGTVTVNGSQAIEIRGRRSSGTTTVNTRTLFLEKVG